MWDDILGLGREGKDLTALQVSFRGVIIFFVVIVMIRVADRRFLSRKTALDAVLGFIMASMMARAVNGSAAFVPTIVGGFVVVLLHRAIAHLCLRNHKIGSLVKGRENLVIEDGRVLKEELERNDFTERDLLEELRMNGGVESAAEVKSAHIERNGKISVVVKK